jgi:protein-S-isoprenylcysteine O-methyltransferase Ste14
VKCSGGTAKTWSRTARRIRVPLGFAFASIYLWLARPNWPSIILGSMVVVMGLALRMVASGQLKKNEELSTAGPYSYTRNPLYLGSIAIGTGFSIASRSFLVWVLLAALFVFIYVPVIRSEEAYLRSAFPNFESYASRVPRLVPKWSGDSVTAAFSRALYLKHREYNALIGAVLMMLAVTAKMLAAEANWTLGVTQRWH